MEYLLATIKWNNLRYVTAPLIIVKVDPTNRRNSVLPWYFQISVVDISVMSEASMFEFLVHREFILQLCCVTASLICR